MTELLINVYSVPYILDELLFTILYTMVTELSLIMMRVFQSRRRLDFLLQKRLESHSIAPFALKNKDKI